MNKLILIHKGNDRFDRPVYECDGMLYVDIDPREHSVSAIYTKNNNDFDGEPLVPVPAGIEIEFVPRRVTWEEV